MGKRGKSEGKFRCTECGNCQDSRYPALEKHILYSHYEMKDARYMCLVKCVSPDYPTRGFFRTNSMKVLKNHLQKDTHVEKSNGLHIDEVHIIFILEKNFFLKYTYLNDYALNV